MPDVIGFKLEDALSVLNSKFQGKIVVVETLGKTVHQEGEARVLQQKIIDDNKMRLVISYF